MKLKRHIKNHSLIQNDVKSKQNVKVSTEKILHWEQRGGNQITIVKISLLTSYTDTENNTCIFHQYPSSG